MKCKSGEKALSLSFSVKCIDAPIGSIYENNSRIAEAFTELGLGARMGTEWAWDRRYWPYFASCKGLGIFDSVSNVMELGAEAVGCPKDGIVKSLYTVFRGIAPPADVLERFANRSGSARELHESFDFNLPVYRRRSIARVDSSRPEVRNVPGRVLLTTPGTRLWCRVFRKPTRPRM